MTYQVSKLVEKTECGLVKFRSAIANLTGGDRFLTSTIGGHQHLG
ncbi:hypothetical protein [Nostoc sp. FACHB-145]|nr:hypothetical protein [Nostoc sp. FACHB-145]